MINVHISINNRTTVASVSAVRIYPKSRQPRKGTMCKYKIYIHGQEVGVLMHAFEDCGINLAKAMLDYFTTFDEETLSMYKTMSLYKILENEK